MADNVYNLKFTLSNGDVIDAGQITAPQGPKGDKGDSADIPYSSSTPFMDGVGSVGSANTVARGDHRHPSDTSRQEKLVSGTNIKTINGQSVLGSGDITISGGGTIDADTLNGLLSGSNGIAIAKNTAGDKVEVKIPNEITISNSQGMAKLSPQTISLFYKPDNVSFLIDGLADGMYKTRGSEQQWYLHQGNVKTLFGNQSIYGSGNIDLYKHNLHIVGTTTGTTDIYCQIISSNNLNIGSLTDLQTILANNEMVCAFGIARVWSDATRNACGISKTHVYAIDGSGIIHTATWQLVSDYSNGLEFADTVTTV